MDAHAVPRPLTRLTASLFLAGLIVLDILTTAPAARADGTERYVTDLLYNGAVILMYPRIDDVDENSSSISLDLFEAHLRELGSGRYRVLAVPQIVEALREGQPLPERTVGITIDDTQATVFTEIWPRLRAARLPFTLFLSTDPLDRESAPHLNWRQVKELAQSPLVTIGNLTASHPHLPDKSDARIREELMRATARIQREVGVEPKLFAYPFGESSLYVRDIVEELGFDAAFGQHSGPVGRTLDLYELPRFVMTEEYANLTQLRQILETLPLPVTDLAPRDTHIAPNDNPPSMGFTLAQSMDNVDQLSCFASDSLHIRLEQIGSRRFEVRLSEALPTGRSRVNCTLPSADERWYWFGRQFYLSPR